MACRRVRWHTGHSCSLGRYQRRLSWGYVLLRFIADLLASLGLPCLFLLSYFTPWIPTHPLPSRKKKGVFLRYLSSSVGQAASFFDKCVLPHDVLNDPSVTIGTMLDLPDV